MIIDFDITILIPFGILWIATLLFMKVIRKKGCIYIFFFSIFYFYVMEAIKYTQFPIYAFDGMKQTIFSDLQWIPIFTLTQNDITTSVLNIVLTIPFGVLTQFLKKDTKKRILVKSLLFSVLLESMQFVVALIVGGTFRVIDINDIIFNTVGGFVGYMLFRLGLRIFFCIKNADVETESKLYLYLRELQGGNGTSDKNVHN